MSEANRPSKQEVPLWVPCLNGTAFMGMKRIGSSEWGEGPGLYVRKSDYERLSEELVTVKQVAAEDFAEQDARIGKLQDEIERLRAALRTAQAEALGCSAAASSEFKTEALHSIIAICARTLNEAAPRDETTAEQR